MVSADRLQFTDTSQSKLLIYLITYWLTLRSSMNLGLFTTDDLSSFYRQLSCIISCVFQVCSTFYFTLKNTPSHPSLRHSSHILQILSPFNINY
jgi:hypothetical protein